METKTMVLKEKSLEVFNAVKQSGGRMLLDAVCAELGREMRSVSANVTDLQKKGLAIREKVAVEGKEKPETYVVLTDEGLNFSQAE